MHQHKSTSISPFLCLFCSTEVSEQKAADIYSPHFSNKRKLIRAAVTDHKPETKYHSTRTNVESTKENKQLQRFVTSYTCNILQQFPCFLISVQLSFLACWAATRALPLLSRAESLATTALLVPPSGVALHVEVVTKGVRKAGRSWDNESKHHCSSSSIMLWGRFF